MGFLWFSEAGFYDFIALAIGSLIGLTATRKWLAISIATTFALNRILLLLWGSTVAFGLSPIIALGAILYCLNCSRDIPTRGFCGLYILDSICCSLLIAGYISPTTFGLVTAVLMYFQLLIMIAGAINDGLLVYRPRGRSNNLGSLRPAQERGLAGRHTGSAHAIGKSSGREAS